MIRGLWRRRTRSRGSKGVSSVIGAITLLIVGLMISTNVFLWALQQNTLYSQKVIESNQLDTDRFSERMGVFSQSYSIDDDEVFVNVTLINEGPVAVQIRTLWVVDSTIDEYNFTNDFAPGSVTNFNPGDSGIVRGTVEIDGVHSSHDFEIWFVTARGNLVSFDESLYEAPPPVRSFGVFSLDWFYFKYTSSLYPTPRSAGIISKPEEDYVAFYIRVTNNYGETMTILSSSMIMFLVEWQEPLFYIVEDVSYGNLWNTDWERDESYTHNGAYSIRADSSDNYLTSMDLDTSDAMSINVTFWYRDHGVDDGDDVYLQFWNGLTYNDIFELGNSAEYTWHKYTTIISAPQYLIEDFHINIDSSGIDYGEYLYIDDVLITKTTGEGEVTLLSDGFENPMGPIITAYDDGNPVTIDPHESQVLIFAAERASLTDWAWAGSIPYEQPGTEGAIVMTALVFTMASEPTQLYAQSLPFQALVLSGD